MFFLPCDKKKKLKTLTQKLTLALNQFDLFSTQTSL